VSGAEPTATDEPDTPPEAHDHERQAAVDRAIDAIRSQFGKGAIRRGSLLGGRPDEAAE
jgi:hypothetical protein